MSAPAMPFTKVLVANRGEIARRVMRTCREMGIATAVVYSDADDDAAFVREADEAVPLGGRAAAESYLRIDAVVAAAVAVGAQAVHPGYGFLAENAAFARAVTDAGLVFVGPSPQAIEAMGSKLGARELLAAAGVPVLPGVEVPAGAGSSDLAGLAEGVGYPLLVKASAGGGGKGMRLVGSVAELADAVGAARREAMSSFGDGTVYLERYLNSARHVEVQIVGDTTGRVVHLHERDCSVQRRHQKVIEEAPAPDLDPLARTALHEAAVQAGVAIGYVGAGTVEFLVSGPDVYFLEVNTRLQVEHPVTEVVLGIDLVRWQLDVAAGWSLPDQHEVPSPSGHAVEARLYAEDPVADYRPSVGRLHRLRFAAAPSLRVDSAVDDRPAEVTPYYDPLLAKVVAHGSTRDEALRRLAGALARAEIHGLRTNRELLVRVLTDAAFLAGPVDTGYLDRADPVALGAPLADDAARARHAVVAVLAWSAAARSSLDVLPALRAGWRNVATEPEELALVDDRGELRAHVEYRRDGVDAGLADTRLSPVAIHALGPDHVDAVLDGVRRRWSVQRATVADHHWWFVDGPDGSSAFREVPRLPEPDAGEAAHEGSLVAPMPGTVVSIAVEPGQRVEAGQVLCSVEAMKMELAVRAPAAGTVETVLVAVGEAVAAGTPLILLAEDVALAEDAGDADG